jgi:hypothetical protein
VAVSMPTAHRISASKNGPIGLPRPGRARSAAPVAIKQILNTADVVPTTRRVAEMPGAASNAADDTGC